MLTVCRSSLSGNGQRRRNSRWAEGGGVQSPGELSPCSHASELFRRMVVTGQSLFEVECVPIVPDYSPVLCLCCDSALLCLLRGVGGGAPFEMCMHMMGPLVEICIRRVGPPAEKV